MSKEYTVLTVTNLSPEQAVAEYVYLPSIVHMDDPAIEAMIDFHSSQPLMFNTSMAMPDARHILENSDYHIGLVFDDKHQLVGLLSLEQILSQHTVSLLEEARVARKDLQVKHVMSPLEKVAAVDFNKLQHAKVGHVVATLQKLQAFYLVVYTNEANEEKSMVRGVFLASNMSKMLGKHLSINPAEAKSVAELTKKLHK
jgi:CBS domain containing-hemolysin-like protein